MSEPLNQLLIRHEGLRLRPYTDTVGKLTIGVGRNLTDVGLTQDEVLILLQNDIERCRCELNKTLPWWIKLGEVREAVLLSLCFNLGITKLLSFKTTLGLIENAQYEQAATHLLATPWAQQVGQRAVDLTEMLRTGSWPAWLASV